MSGYNDDTRHLVVAYALEHGDSAAARHFNLHRGTVARWRKAHETPAASPAASPSTDATPAASPAASSSSSYDDKFRREVVAFALDHSDAETARRFGVSVGSVRNWRKQHDPGSRSIEGRDEHGRFKPGTSGNPEGIPTAQQRARALFAEGAAEYAELLLEELRHTRQTPAGSRDLKQLFELGDRIADRGLGLPTARQEVSGPEGRAIEVKTPAELFRHHYGVDPRQGPDIDADLSKATSPGQEHDDPPQDAPGRDDDLGDETANNNRATARRRGRLLGRLR